MAAGASRRGAQMHFYSVGFELATGDFDDRRALRDTRAGHEVVNFWRFPDRPFRVREYA